MATSQKNSKSPTIRRILREAAELANASSPDYAAEPLESDLFEWHFTLRGPPNSVYGEGIYHGRIVLPPSYPLRPPSFRFSTPNGRFEANREICLSISGHHEETWQPAWGIRTALVALRSFMETDVKGQLGGLETTDEVRRRLAKASASYRCPTCGRTNAVIMEECEKRCREASAPEDHVEVPKELSLAWRDELKVAESQNRSSVPGRQQPVPTARDETSEEAELAEGFVQTTTRGGVADTCGAASDRLRPASGHGSQVSISSANPRPRLANMVRQEERRGDAGIPVWIDRAIVALVAMLIALVLKVLFG